MIETRFTLAAERIREIQSEATETIAAPFDAWFVRTAQQLIVFLDEYEYQKSGAAGKASLEELKAHNEALYADILPKHYDESFCNPAFAVQVLGEDFGRLLSAVSYEMRAVIPYLFDRREERAVIRLELFLELYSAFVMAKREPEGDLEVPEAKYIRGILYSYLSDYAEEETLYEVQDKLTTQHPRMIDWIKTSDLSDVRYLYELGDYISRDEIETAQFLETLPEETIAAMADTFTEGYRIGFVTTGKDLDSKKTVGLIYHYGFERMMQRAACNFEALGKQCNCYRTIETLFRMASSTGCESTNPNPQYTYDHKEDLGLFLDDAMLQRKLEALQAAYKNEHEKTILFAGPAVEETFGETPFSPKQNAAQVKFNEQQQGLVARYRSLASNYYNEAVIGRNRSFTIISFPLPSIADSAERYHEIFDAVIRINTLDYHEYQTIQQTIIDALDQADRVHVLGQGDNRTDLTVNLWKLTDPAKQTIFENCVADVNIPVGEVFTSPVLKGTNGVLHVTGVYLEGLFFKDLSMTFTDGMVTDYACENFAGEDDAAAKGRAYIEENILFHHKSLPMGECAIGTNTTAYAAGIQYGISGKLPILIAEKTGPHFAVGDTCYSQDEDNTVYNPDGKEIVAKENDFSLLRNDNPEKAYFGCHTDITIPYAELGAIEAVHADGNVTEIIKDGRFVLVGTEALNKPLDTL